MAHFDTGNFALQRYANLVKLQCATVDPSLEKTLHQEPIAHDGPYSFYPLFCAAAKARYLFDANKNISGKQQKTEARNCRHLKDKAVSVLRRSGVNPMLREIFLWHMEDGLQ
jgi:hypothetical protein